MTTYTIDSIRSEMSASGSHWWDIDSMRFFRTRVGEQVYQGENGIYFVTSERGPTDPRAYSVRQYDPATKQIETIGEFNAYTRAKAHRIAAKLAGANSVVVAAIPTEITPVTQLVIDIGRGGGWCNDFYAGELIRLATFHHRLMEEDCNTGGLHDCDGNPSPRLENTRKAITRFAQDCKCGVAFSGDPRGCTVKLTLPNGKTNDWAGEGWCVPTR